MSQFSARQFSTRNTNPSTKTIPRKRRTPLSSSRMISFAQSSRGGYPQNVNFSNNSELYAIPEPSSDLYNQNQQIHNVHSLRRMNQSPLSHIQTGESSLAHDMPNNFESQRRAPSPPTPNETSNIFKANRHNRLQVLRRKSAAPNPVPEGIIREQRTFTNRWPNLDNGNRNTAIYTSDGKKLEEILTKVLKRTDICQLSRIVLPKRKAEMNLPTLRNRVGIDHVFQDVSSDDLQWIFKYKFWVNNKSRMYVLENTGDFVKHYGLKAGDSIILYKDEVKKLYVGFEKSNKLEDEEVSEAAPNMEMLENDNSSDTMDEQQPEACLPLPTEEHNKKEAEAASSSTFLPSNGGASSSATVAQLDQLPNEYEGAHTRAAAVAAAAATTVDGETIDMNKEMKDRLDDFFATIDMDFFQPGVNYYPNYDHDFDHLTDFDMWP